MWMSEWMRLWLVGVERLSACVPATCTGRAVTCHVGHSPEELDGCVAAQLAIFSSECLKCPGDSCWMCSGMCGGGMAGFSSLVGDSFWRDDVTGGSWHVRSCEAGLFGTGLKVEL